MGFGLHVDLSCSIIFVLLSVILYYITFFKAIDVFYRTNGYVVSILFGHNITYKIIVPQNLKAHNRI